LIKSYKGELLTVSKYSRHRNIQMLEVYNDEVIREQNLPRFYDVFNASVVIQHYKEISKLSGCASIHYGVNMLQ